MKRHRTTFTDQYVECVDCGGTFRFSAAAQETYERKGFAPRKRCDECVYAQARERAAAAGQRPPHLWGVEIRRGL